MRAATRSTRRFHRLHCFCGGSESGISYIVPVVGMDDDEAVFGPSGDGLLVDIEPRGRFLFYQQSTFPQAVIT